MIAHYFIESGIAAAIVLPAVAQIIAIGAVHLLSWCIVKLKKWSTAL